MSPITKKTFGSTGINVGQIGFGAMSLAGMTKPAVEQDKVNEILQECLENGINVIDTSDIYTQTATQQLGYGEKQIGQFLAKNKDRRNEIFLCTKFAMRFIDGSMIKDSSAKWCLEACKNSLERLQVDFIDLYYCHRYDGKTDPKETAKAMKQLKEEGKIRFVGVSEFPIEKLKEFNEICHVDAIQNEFSPFTPEVLRLGIIKWCEENGTAYVAYSPLGRGVFTGAIKKPEDVDPLYKQINLPRLSNENFDKNVKLVEKIESIATHKGVKPGHITLAWVIAKSPLILPIPGTSKLENLKDNIAASKTKLTQEEITAIDDIVNSFKVSGQRYFGAGNDNLSH